MSGINLNNSEEFVREIKIFNNGRAGIVENVRVRIEKKNNAKADDKSPHYKLIAKDELGEINEGFYYQVPDEKGELNGFTKYQAQRLIMLARGVLGENVQFPLFNTPTETLDGVMKMVAPELSKGFFRVAACYGTTKKKAQYLGFKSFGHFIQPMSVPNGLTLSTSDSLIRGEAKPATPENELIATVTGNPPNLDWLETK